ncbi:hypothetical protein BDK51DRAFT_46509 [Blyttiomyces helicus]|uniref:Ras-GEF domain-containing protein n=1 Tax=Blyttiomyces helicus TaxID=388810 RepID=A0A4P9WFM5_9FUNG|nr:hypothetical protein BDK51DRAFT_46509 [Blyttiomyces helicus]|eukprot:RKO90563.1 hypothetical protein BDK51DRAFT_46509 [Blyttiomyces helicus]
MGGTGPRGLAIDTSTGRRPKEEHASMMSPDFFADPNAKTVLDICQVRKRKRWGKDGRMCARYGRRECDGNAQEGDADAVSRHFSRNSDSLMRALNLPLDTFGNTPLHLAVHQCDLVLTNLLLLKGADPNVVNRSGVSPTVTARRMGFFRIVRILKKHGGVVPNVEDDRMRGGFGGRRRARGGEDVGADSGDTGMRRRATSLPFEGVGSAAPGGKGGGAKSGVPRGASAGDMPPVDGKGPAGTMPTVAGSTGNIADGGIGNSNASLDGGGGASPEAASAPSTAADDLARARVDSLRWVRKALPKNVLPIYDAAYVGAPDTVFAAAEPVQFISVDDDGSTTLMKAAFRGHVGVLRETVRRGGVDVDTVDGRGIAALTWAAIAGRVDAVRFLLIECRADVNGKRSEEVVGPANFAPTPLVAAAFGGFVDVVELLLARGAAKDLRIGPGRGVSAVMVAAWMRHESVVRVLISNGASVDGEVETWLKKGIIFLKRRNLELNAWLGGTATRSGLSGFGSHPDLTNARGRKASLKETMAYFDSGENAAVAALEALIVSTEDIRSEKEVKNEKEDTSERLLSQIATLKPRTPAPHRRNERFREGLNLDVSRARVKPLNLRFASCSTGTLHGRGAKVRMPVDIRARPTSHLHPAPHPQKLIGYNPELILDLTDRLPERGTELDRLCFTVFQCVIQLVIAANRNLKHQFIAIAAKEIHHADEIVRAVEATERAPLRSGAGAGVALSPLSATSPTKGRGPPDPTAWSFFAATPVRNRIRELVKVINVDLLKQLMPTTRIAIGVWPPPSALSDMIKSAADVARACREVADLVNMIGYYPILDAPLEVNFKDFEADDVSREVSQATTTEKPATVLLNYDEYKRKNDLKVIEEMSKQVARNAASPDSQLPAEPIGEPDPDAGFFARLDALLVQFVSSVSDVKRAHDAHLKEEYVTLTSKVNERAEFVVDEIRGFDLLHDLADDMALDPAEIARIESRGVRLGVPGTVAATFKPLWKRAFDDVGSASRALMAKGLLASGVYPPTTAARDMLAATIPCVVAVKKLVTLTKEGTSKLRRSASEDRRKKEIWRRDCLQNERVKQLFLMWESQVMQPQVAGAAEQHDDTNKDDERVLEDSRDGLVTEDGGLKIFTYWLETHFEEDFMDNEALVLRLRDFVQRKVAFDFEAIAQKLTALLEEKLTTPLTINPPPPPTTADRVRAFPKPLVPRNLAPAPTASTTLPPTPTPDALRAFLFADPRAFLEVEPLEMARQLAILDLERFQRVKPHECLDQIWGDKRMKERVAARLGAPGGAEPADRGGVTGIQEMIRHTNSVRS